MTTRYIVTEPVPHGNAWWRVADTQNKHTENQTMADFFRDMPNAEQEARALCQRLNEGIEGR